MQAEQVGDGSSAAAATGGGGGGDAAGPGSAAAAELVAQARQLLHRRLRIEVPDGRVLVGEFQCLDPQGNVVLGGAHERIAVGGAPHEKPLGQVLVPAAQRARCEVEAMPHEAEAFAAFLGAAGGSGGDGGP